MSKKKHKKRVREAEVDNVAAIKLPKKIGGVKLPRMLREHAERIVAQASGPAGRELAAAGLMLAASALRQRVPAGEPAKGPPAGGGSASAKREASAPASDLAKLVETMVGAAGVAFAEAIRKK